MNHIQLGDVAHIEMGQSPDSTSYNKNGVGVPLLNGPAEFGLATPVAVQWTTQPLKFAEPGDILFCVRASLGRQNTADRRYAIGRGLAAIRARSGKADTEFLGLWLNFKAQSILASGNGSTFPSVSGDHLRSLGFPSLDGTDQKKIAASLRIQLAEVEAARISAEAQLRDISNLEHSIIVQSLREGATDSYLLGDALCEVKQGIGSTWREYSVHGATREGLAPAKEPPGKHAWKYKPACPGTVFYNPMRILIGSIAFVDEDDESGITSPDYVVLQGRPGIVDSRWFYHWLRSPLGVQCINTLARGAVRERMLFNRLAEGGIELPSFAIQQKTSLALKELKPLRTAVQEKLQEIDLLSSKILTRAFED